MFTQTPDRRLAASGRQCNTLGDLSTDYKARKLNDTIVILVAVQTTAAQSGDSNYQRTVQTSSAITGLAGAREDHRPESAAQCQLLHRAQGMLEQRTPIPPFKPASPDR